MANKRQHRCTQLITVRLWLETTEGDQAEVRGRVQHVLNGEARYFRMWQELTAVFEGILQELKEPYSVLGDTLMLVMQELPCPFDE